MKISSQFKLVQIADEYIIVPVNEKAKTFKGIVSLTEEAAFLLKLIDGKRQPKDLLPLVLDEYEVTKEVAAADIERMLQEFRKLGIIEEE